MLEWKLRIVVAFHHRASSALKNKSYKLTAIGPECHVDQLLTLNIWRAVSITFKDTILKQVSGRQYWQVQCVQLCSIKTLVSTQHGQ
jgi:hypothetical protein